MTRKYGGTSLGLAITCRFRQVVGRHERREQGAERVYLHYAAPTEVTAANATTRAAL